MALHPIKALDHVIDEYRDHLRSEFRAKDPALRHALEQELDAPGFLAREPFFQAHRPFRSGKRWIDLPIDPKLAKVMKDQSRSDTAYLHQSLAIEELLSPSARPVVVTTGTGSGKTEAFLIPVIQNAFEDSAAFKKSGLTAILVYPMNALANDQKQRIERHLADAGFSGAVRVEQYDRSTSAAKRAELRDNPPHVLLTNYMMLEYLLVRPADRENIFANHRCRFLVLDEVHTYRGILGSNIGLLVRRLKVHLAHATQGWKPDVPDNQKQKRYPSIIPIGTSATIKSVDEEGLSRDQIIRLRDEAVQEFFGNLTGVERQSIQVFGEELQDVVVPAEASYPVVAGSIDHHDLDTTNIEMIRTALCRLAKLPESMSLEEAAKHYRLLWDLNRWLIRKPMSGSQIVDTLRSEIPERSETPQETLYEEVLSALILGASFPDGTPGVLRLRVHRFIRGGWKFHRCVNPDCGKLFPMGEEQCSACNSRTAPLYICRNCGADYLRFVGNPDTQPLMPSPDETQMPEWMLYEPSKFDIQDESEEEGESEDDSETGVNRGSHYVPDQIKKRPVKHGSFDPMTLMFSSDVEDYEQKVILAPARSRCLCCGGTAGSRNVITAVALGTSAAVKVLSEGFVEALSEANQDRPGHDKKERLLIFSDSRQDAAHQARFIFFASRYDRMRRRVMGLLKDEPVLSFQRVIELLAESAVTHRDNPNLPEDTDWIPEDMRNRIQVWEEAPLLDEISITAGYRATLINLGLAGVRYHELSDYVRIKGEPLAAILGIKLNELEYICRVLLDEMRVRGALSRPMLRYHPMHVACPVYFKDAEWERRMKQPQGYALSKEGNVVPNIEAARIPNGIKVYNPWRKPKAGGRGPSLERLLTHLLKRFGGVSPQDALMIAVLEFLSKGKFIIASELFGAKDRYKLLQVNADVIRIVKIDRSTRRRCDVCSSPRHEVSVGMPCPKCHGNMIEWPDEDVDANRTVKRIRMVKAIPLVAGEHTAQITTTQRLKLENDFKARPEISPVNILACSPTLEMGIDVGGLDAVIMRNIPPRPDNYAQRGGRAGRRSRVGIVAGYTRSTPHDQYFYEKPREMIAGEVPAPIISLGNRDVLTRHLFAIAFGAAEPGLAGKMVDYVSPDGTIREEAVSALIEAVKNKSDYALSVARVAWGDDVFERADLDEAQTRKLLEALPARIRFVIDSTSRQVIELRQALDYYAQSVQKKYAGVRAGELVARLLGIPSDTKSSQSEADDRSAGYPLRRFAEFGLLPGYEFPSEPSSLRLLGDEYEEDPVTVTRRFGIGQFQPEAHVYARKKRWKVIGLDTASPWNPQSEGPTWNFRLCRRCDLRYNASEPKCPRCNEASPGQGIPGYDLAGFLAKTDERPILDEEDRFAVRNLVRCYPQWDGRVVGRWTVANGWGLRLSRNEEVRWLNEGPPPKDDLIQPLHPYAQGWYLCPACGRILEPPVDASMKKGGRKRAGGLGAEVEGGRRKGVDVYGHYESCPHRGSLPMPIAITTSGKVEVLRLLVTVPSFEKPKNTKIKSPWESWGISLGYALLYGIQHYFMIDASELDFELEGPWKVRTNDHDHGVMALSFIDVGIGGSGYLERIAESFDRVADRTLEHLDHKDCETACYRCLKGYRNQRYHDILSWPQLIPTLQELAHAPAKRRSLETGDLDDPRPWLEAYAAGVGSPLELQFLKLFEKHGFHPQKQVPIILEGDQRAISVADFAVPEKRIAIYIDGAAFHTGENLRRDKFIRDRMRNAEKPWRVLEIGLKNLKDSAAIIKKLTS